MSVLLRSQGLIPREVKTFSETSAQTPMWWIQNVRLLNCVFYIYTFAKHLLRGCALSVTSLSITLPRNKGGLQLFLPYIARSSERHSLQCKFLLLIVCLAAVRYMLSHLLSSFSLYLLRSQRSKKNLECLSHGVGCERRETRPGRD